MKIREIKKELRKFTLEVDENELNFIWYWCCKYSTDFGAATRLNTLVTEFIPNPKYPGGETCFL